jgi:gamma-glutamyltranspeptidase/glutathione hydrolase
LQSREQNLKRSAYAKATFYKNGKLLQEGDALRQPKLADTLDGIKQKGTEYFYNGKWAHDFIDVIVQLGGVVTVEDLKSYQAIWDTPLSSNYKGYKIFAPSHRSYGGVKLLLSMKILEQLDIKKIGHWSASVDALECMILISRIVDVEGWLHFKHFIDDRAYVNSKLTLEYANKILEKIEEQKFSIYNYSRPHSAHIIIKDSQGMVVSGTHTINSMPWGEHAIFVGGVALNDFGYASLGVGANQFMPSATSIELVFDSDKLILASGFFASSMFPADFQVLTNILDFDMNLETALKTPRFGNAMLDFSSYPPIADNMRNMIDMRFTQAFKEKLRLRGINVTSEGYVDTGMGVLLQIDYKNKVVRGMSPPELLGGVADGF